MFNRKRSHHIIPFNRFMNTHLTALNSLSIPYRLLRLLWASQTNYLYPDSAVVPDHDITKPAPASSYLRWASEKLYGFGCLHILCLSECGWVCVCVLVCVLCTCVCIIVLALCEVRCLKCCTCLANRMPGLEDRRKYFGAACPENPRKAPFLPFCCLLLPLFFPVSNLWYRTAPPVPSF